MLSDEDLPVAIPGTPKRVRLLRLLDGEPAVERRSRIRQRHLAPRLLSSGIAYLTSDAALTSPFVSSFRVREQLPADTKKLAQALRARGIGTLEIKKRGVDIDPAVLRKKLSLRGDEAATLIVTRVGSKRLTLLADRV